MEILQTLLEYFLHIDKYLAQIIDQYGILSYLVLFGIIFMETGFVVTPFLPGDSLLFAAGALAATGSLHIATLLILIIAAAFLGDTANYWIGHYIGPKAFRPDAHVSFFGLKMRIGKLLKPEYLKKAQAFYEKHGGKAIVLARFVPIVRTFAPFVAGVGLMNYKNFLQYNLLGGVLWVTLFLLSGYFFGTIPFVQDNFHYVVVVIIAISVVPIVLEWRKARAEARQEA